MKDRNDFIRGWLRKARSDAAALETLIAAESFDTACFHAQQAAEKYLKALLIHFGLAVPRTHNLAKLVEVAAETDPALLALIPHVEPLTPYAVETRYDDEFWPSLSVAEEARSLLKRVEEEVAQRLPPELKQ